MRNTPDVSGNVRNELERMIGIKFAMYKQGRITIRPNGRSKPVPMNGVHCSGQRGADERRR